MATSILQEVLRGSSDPGEQLKLENQINEFKGITLQELEKLSQLLDDVYVDVVADSLAQADTVVMRLGDMNLKVETEVERLKARLALDRSSANSNQIERLKEEIVELESCLDSLAVAKELADVSDDMQLLQADAQPLALANNTRRMELLLDELDAKVKSSQDESMGSRESGAHQEISFAQVFNRMRYALLTSLEYHQSQLLFTLNQWWTEAFVWEQSATDLRRQPILRSAAHVNRLKFDFAKLDHDTAQQFMTALHGTEELGLRVQKFAEQLMRLFITPIIHNTRHPSSEPSHCRLQLDNRPQCLNGDRALSITYYEQKQTTTGATSVAEPTAVLDALQLLFELLHQALGAQVLEFPELSDSTLTVKFYNSLGVELRHKLIHEIKEYCLKPAVPPSPDAAAEQAFQQLMARAELFEAKAKELGLFPAEWQAFAEITKDLDRFAVDRRCQTILDAARQLVKQPLHHTQTVGERAADSIDRQTLEERLNAVAPPLNSLDPDDDSDALLPMFKFPRCKVSSSVVQLVDLLESTMSAVCDDDSVDALTASRLFETCRLIVALFIDLTPLVHKHAIQQVPLNAAVYYNSAYYVAQACMTLGARSQSQLHNKLQLDDNLRKIVTVGFIDLVPRLRSLAADAIRVHLNERIDECDRSIQDGSLFTGLDKAERLQACERAVHGCVNMLTQLSNVWQEVLTIGVRLTALASLASHLLNRCFGCIAQLEDIAADDAKHAANILRQTIKAVEALFKVDGTPYHLRFLDRSHARCSELVYVLEGSLQDIADRWCDGAGPAADCLSADAMERLIRALFQNTEKRAALIHTIRK